MNSSQQTQAGSWRQSDFSVLPQKYSQIVHPPPTGTFVFIDEHEDSIDDGLWNTDPFGGLVWYNIPTVRHNQSANIAYADGSVRPRKWLWPSRKWNRSNISQGPENALDQQDLAWLMQLSPVQR
jgi:prepilin-type processing-associated H-X9-DG protein